MQLSPKVVSCIGLLFVFSLVGSAQVTDEASARAKVIAMEHAWNQAEAFKDLKALDTLFDNSLTYVDYEGALLTKAEFLSRVKSSHLQQVVTESLSVQLYGTTAVVSGLYQSNELVHGKPITRRGRFVDTWVLRNTTWVCVAAQSTPISY